MAKLLLILIMAGAVVDELTSSPSQPPLLIDSASAAPASR